MKKLLRQLYIQNRGGIFSIEFALIFPCLVMMFIFVLELSRVMLIGSSLDLVMTEVSRKIAITENNKDYKQLFITQLESDFSWWPILASINKTQLNVSYCDTINDVLNNNCSTDADEKPLILFEVNYQYNAIFSPLFSDLIDASLMKKAVLYREFY